MAVEIISWKAHVRALDTVTARSLSWPAFPSDATIWTQIHSLDRALRAVSEEVLRALPLPSPESYPDAGVDAAVTTLVEAAFDGTPPDEKAVSLAVEAERAEVRNDRVEILLPPAGPAVANWYVLVGVLADEFDTLTDDLRRVAGRLELTGNDTESRAFQDIVEAIGDTAAALERAAVRTLWLNPPENLVDIDSTWVQKYATRTVRLYNQCL